MYWIPIRDYGQRLIMPSSPPSSHPCGFRFVLPERGRGMGRNELALRGLIARGSFLLLLSLPNHSERGIRKKEGRGNWRREQQTM